MMKTKIYLGLCVVCIASCLSVLAEDNPAQAAARAALVKMLMDSNPPQTQPVSNITSLYAIEPPAELATAKTNPAPAMPEPSRELTSRQCQLRSDKRGSGRASCPAVRTIAGSPRCRRRQFQPRSFPPPPRPSSRLNQRRTAPTAPKPAGPMILGNTPNPSAQAKPGTELVTVYGTVYKNTQVEKVYWDGILVSYSMSGGGIGMTKVYFKDLPPDVRQQYEK